MVQLLQYCQHKSDDKLQSIHVKEIVSYTRQLALPSLKAHSGTHQWQENNWLFLIKCLHFPCLQFSCSWLSKISLLDKCWTCPSFSNTEQHSAGRSQTSYIHSYLRISSYWKEFLVICLPGCHISDSDCRVECKSYHLLNHHSIAFHRLSG